LLGGGEIKWPGVVAVAGSGGGGGGGGVRNQGL
jgi:hypothetical protein